VWIRVGYPSYARACVWEGRVGVAISAPCYFYSWQHFFATSASTRRRAYFKPWESADTKQKLGGIFPIPVKIRRYFPDTRKKQAIFSRYQQKQGEKTF